MKFNQEFVYPEHARRPEWVSDRLNRFHQKLKKDVDEKTSLKILRDRLIDNLETNILPSKVKIKKQINKKYLNELIQKIVDVTTDDIDFMWYYWLLMQAGFTLSSVIPSSFSPEALILPPQFAQEKDKNVKIFEESKKTIDDAIKFNNGMKLIAEKVKRYFEEHDISVVDLMNSGAKGDVSHIQSLLLAVGLSINSFGEINDVISNSHTEGLTQTQFFNGSSQAIQALYAKSSSTAIPGYAGRKLAAISERIKLSSIKDCGTKNYLNLKVSDSKILEALDGRYYKNKIGLEVQIDKNSDIINKTIQLRSPLYCKATDGICSKCYNPKFVQKSHFTPGENIGLVASTGLTGTLVNLTLKKSHVGVTLDKENVDFRKEIRDM